MSKGAGKIALGQGLMSFGQGIGQAMDAQERRRQSLEDIRNRFNTQMALINQRQAIADQADAEDWARGAPEREARLGLIQAQTEATQALAADRNRVDPMDAPTMFGLGDPDRYTVESVAAAERHLQENPRDRAGARALLQPRAGDGNSMFDPERVARDAADRAREALSSDEYGSPVPLSDQVPKFVERNPEIAQEAGIAASDSPPVAARKLAEWETRSFMNAPGDSSSGLMGGQVSEQDVIGVINGLLGQGDGDFIQPSAFEQWSGNQ